MGSKNNNGKFDFKAAGPRWTAFRKERVLQGYRMTLTWMVSQSCGEVGRRLEQFVTIYQVDKKDFFVWRNNHCDIWETPDQSQFSCAGPGLDFTPHKQWNPHFCTPQKKKKKSTTYLIVSTAVLAFGSQLWTVILQLFSQLQILGGAGGWTVMSDCEILILAGYKMWI